MARILWPLIVGLLALACGDGDDKNTALIDLGLRLRETSNNQVSIDTVVSPSSAEQAGLEAGDVIESIADEKIDSVDAAQEEFSDLQPGSSVNVSILRFPPKQRPNDPPGTPAAILVVLTYLDKAAAASPTGGDRSRTVERVSKLLQDRVDEGTLDSSEKQLTLTNLFTSSARLRVGVVDTISSGGVTLVGYSDGRPFQVRLEPSTSITSGDESGPSALTKGEIVRVVMATNETAEQIVGTGAIDECFSSGQCR